MSADYADLSWVLPAKVERRALGTCAVESCELLRTLGGSVYCAGHRQADALHGQPVPMLAWSVRRG